MEKNRPVACSRFQTAGCRIALLAIAICASAVSSSSSADELRVGEGTSRAVAGIAIRPASLEKVLADERTESRPIVKTILGSAVTGTQSTVTRVTAVIKTDPERLHFELRNVGSVSSTTSSRNSQALIDSTGNHTFEVIKPVYFDGENWLTRKCYGSIQARETPFRVQTSFSGSPLFGPTADQIAWREVLRRGPEIDQAVAEDLSRDILPEIDRQTDLELADLDQQWTLFRQLVEINFPESELRWKARSAPEGILLSAMTSHPTTHSSDAGTRDLHFQQRCLSIADREDIVVWLSEEAATDFISRFMPSEKLSDAALAEIIRKVTAGEVDWVGKTITEINAELQEVADQPAVLYSMEFAEVEPVRIEFRDGRIRVSARMQVHPKLGMPSGWFNAVSEYQGAAIDRTAWTVRNTFVEANPEQAFTSLKIPVDDLELRPQDDSGLRPQDTDESVLPWKSLIETSVRNLLQQIPEPRLPRTLELSSLSRKLSDARIHRIQCEEGWIRISLAF